MPKKAWGKGGNKAFRAMVKKYGRKKGEKIFFAKANKYGKKGSSRPSKIRSTFGKGKRLRRSGRKKK